MYGGPEPHTSRAPLSLGSAVSGFGYAYFTDEELAALRARQLRGWALAELGLGPHPGLLSRRLGAWSRRTGPLNPSCLFSSTSTRGESMRGGSEDG